MKRGLCIVAMLVFVISHLAFAQSPAPAPPDKTKAIAVARELIAQVPYASFVTIGAKGQANARIVQPAPPDEKFVVWIVSVKTSRKVAELRRNPHATLLYFDQAKMAYVTLLGSTSIVAEPAEKERHWLPAWDPFFVGGARNPDLVLVRFEPRSVEIVSPAHKLMGDTWGLAIIDLQ